MISYLLWLLLVLLGLLGWGKFVFRILRFEARLSGSAAVLIFGIAAEGFIGASVMLAGWGSAGFWTGLQCFGAFYFILSSFFLKKNNELRNITQKRHEKLIAATTVILVAMIGLRSAMTRAWNPCDDDPAYLYLARRIWQVGDLADPFNNRRLSSSGLFSFLQAIVMGPFGEGALNNADEVIGALILLFAFWQKRRDGSLFYPGLFVVGTILLSHQYLGGANSSPVLFPIAVLIATIPMLGNAKKTIMQLRFEGTLYGFGFGVLTLSRPFFSIFSALVFLVALTAYEQLRSKSFVICTAISISVVTAPWLVLNQRDVNTPLFPFIKGNLASNFLFNDASRVSIKPTLLSSIEDIAKTHWPLAILLVILVYILIVQIEPKFRPDLKADSIFYVGIVLAAIVFYIFFAVSVRRTGPAAAFPRFWAPVFGLLMLLPVKKLQDSDWSIPWQTSIASAIASLVLFLPTVNGVWTVMSSTIRTSVSGEMAKSFEVSLYPESKEGYGRIKEMIPDSSRVLLAVQLPHLLLSKKFDAVSIDIAGATVDGIEFPFYQSFREKRQWLLDNNFDYLVVTHSDSSSCLFGKESWDSNLGKNNTYEDWMYFVTDWIQFADQVRAESKGVISTGDISLLSLDS